MAIRNRNARLFILRVPRQALGLTAICRQIHAEAALLPFKMSTFQIRSDGSFPRFLGKLSKRQQDAISTVELIAPDAFTGALLWDAVTFTPGSDDISQHQHLDWLEWSSSLALDQLPGLKKVLVEYHWQWDYSWKEGLLGQGLAHCVRGRAIPVIVASLPPN